MLLQSNTTTIFYMKMDRHKSLVLTKLQFHRILSLFTTYLVHSSVYLKNSIVSRRVTLLNTLLNISLLTQ